MAGPQMRPQDESDEPLLHRLVGERLALFGLAGQPELVRLQHRARERAWCERFGGAGRQVITLPAADPVPDRELTPAVGRIWTADDGDNVRIVDLAVLSAFHRRGIGTYAVQAVRQQADKVLVLTVARDNVAAQTFYARLGFLQIGEDELDLLLGLA